MAALACACALSGCAEKETVNTLRLNLSLPPGWEDLLDMTVLGAPAGTPFLGSVRLTFECAGVERSYETAYERRSLVLEGLDLDPGCSVRAEGVTAGRVIFRKARAGIPVGGGGAADLHLALEPTNGFSAAGSLLHPRQYASAVPTGDSVLIVGGSLDTRVIEEYDIASGAMTAYAASLNYARTRQTAVLDNSGEKIFIFMGADIAEVEDNVFEVVDIANVSSKIFSLSSYRKKYFPIKYQGIILIGGYDQNENWLVDSLFIDEQNENNQQLLSLGLLDEVADNLCYSQGEYGFCAGGMFGAEYSNHIHRFDLKRSVELTTIFFEGGWRDFSSSDYGNEKFILSGGFGAAGYLNEVHEFDVSIGQLDLIGNIQGRSQHTSTRLLDGKMLIIGGNGPGAVPASAEIFDPATGQSEPLPWRLHHPRVGHTATLLPDGRVLIVGGNMGTKTYEIYNPVQSSYSLQSGAALKKEEPPSGGSSCPAARYARSCPYPGVDAQPDDFMPAGLDVASTAG